MKKLTLLLGAVALLGLASCNEQIEMPSNNGAKKGEVVSSMTINIATKANTKVTAEAAQATGAFRGMEQMSLFVSKDDLTTDNNDFLANYKFDLGSLAANDISAQHSSKVYQLTMPVGIRSMAFYGKATKAEGASDKEFGKMGFTVGANKAGTHFDVAPIVSSTTEFDAAAAKLAKVLNDVIGVESWAALAAAEETAVDITALPLRDAYKELTTIQNGEVRAGSAAAVKAVLDTLGAICSKISASSVAPASVKSIATAITAAIDNTLGGVDADFPCNLGLPAGAAQLTFANGAFSYVASPEAMGSGNGVALGKFAYPVELAYWVVSPIRVTSEDVAESDYPVTVSTWDADENWRAKSWTKNGTVTASTKGVALQNNINYGTALLKSTVKVAAPSSESTTNASTSTISDNRNAIQTRIYGAANAEPDQAIAITDGMFELVGILVGGQPGRVGWDFTPASAAATDNVVYDTYFGSSAVSLSSTASAPLYTMVFDNRVADGNQSNVMVALELKNKTGKPFYGNANIIPADGIFYLVGILDPTKVPTDAVASAISALTGNGYYYPYASQYSVFMQDFVTTANFTITSLKGAYSTVPDLRSAEMNFGLSVDLDWKAGLSFDVELK
ncbi:MAG: hypothetical protein IKI13_00365 [Bacteroidales bacterium]|nr:hypothetical protein [Bacteroidales bacterium]